MASVRLEDDPVPSRLNWPGPTNAAFPKAYSPQHHFHQKPAYFSLELSSICNEIHTRHRTPQPSNKQITFHACFASLFGEKGEHLIGVRGEFYTPRRSSAGRPSPPRRPSPKLVAVKLPRIDPSYTTKRCNSALHTLISTSAQRHQTRRCEEMRPCFQTRWRQGPC